MKRILILFCVVVLFITCTKEKVTPPATSTPDIVGTWTLYSWDQTSTSASQDYSVTKYPCMGENVLKVNADNTTLTSFTGTDTCYVTPQHAPASGSSFIGHPGQAPYAGTWSQNGNNYYLGATLRL